MTSAPTGVTPEMVTAILASSTPREEVRQRQGPGGKTLDYVDARYVMGKLDELGAENWQCDYRMEGAKVACGIGILITFPDSAAWVWKWDGAGETDIEGEKGSFSDAFKRAGVKWGIARDLYPSPHQAPGRHSSPTGSRPPAVEMAVAGADEDDETWEKAKAIVAGKPVEGSQCPEHPQGGTWRHNDKGGMWHGPKGVVKKADGSDTYHSWWAPKDAA